MAVDPSVVVSLAAEFVGKKAFKEADTATQKLMGNVKKLAGALGLAFGTSAVIAYGKASVKAFAEDEAAAKRLTTAVENLGIGFANPQIADYIGNLEKSAAIADDVLRPAFQSLLTTTGSLTKSQELLNNAIQISRASGIDLATVSNDLAKGYVGQTRGLAKYNSGLTRAELQTKSFSEILGVLLTRSAGAAEDYLGSTSYQMEVLSIATGNASEIIGGGLVDAFARIGGGSETADAAIAIEGIASAIAKITVATGTAIGAIPNLLKNLKNLPKNIFMGFAGKQAGVNLESPQKKENKLTLTQVQQQQALAKLEAAAAKRNKEILALKQKQVAADKNKLAIEKANLALGKGEEVFDIEKIQLKAAEINQAEQLGKVTSQAQLLQVTNDLARLRLKQSILALDEAIATGDVKAITAATNRLNEDLKIFGALSNQKIKLAEIGTILKGIAPKDLINLENLYQALDLLKQINTGSPAGAALSMGAPPVMPSSLNPIAGAGGVRPSRGFTNEELAYFEARDQYQFGGSLSGLTPTASSGSVNITVNTGVGDPNAIAEAIDDVLRQARSRGTLVALP
jgi:hypothetical protein